jgi:hypothetical protein
MRLWPESWANPVPLGLNETEVTVLWPGPAMGSSRHYYGSRHSMLIKCFKHQ